MNQPLDVSTIILAALAIFIVWKLRSVLGTRTGEERPPFNPFVRRGSQPPQNATPSEGGTVVPLPGAASRPVPNRPADPWIGLAEPGSALARSLDKIAAADPSFNGRMFVDGARNAYEMILDAFAKGDRKTLSGLLAKDVYDGFDAAITDRESRKETLRHTMVSLDEAAIEDARLDAGTAQITMRFESNQINAVRSADQNIVAGGSDAVSPVVDHWTFARVLSASDPNWTLSATSDA